MLKVIKKDIVFRYAAREQIISDKLQENGFARATKPGKDFNNVRVDEGGYTF